MNNGKRRCRQGGRGRDSEGKGERKVYCRQEGEVGTQRKRRKEGVLKTGGEVGTQRERRKEGVLKTGGGEWGLKRKGERKVY